MAVILVEPENWKVCMFNNRARLHYKYQYIILFSTKKEHNCRWIYRINFTSLLEGQVQIMCLVWQFSVLHFTAKSSQKVYSYKKIYQTVCVSVPSFFSLWLLQEISCQSVCPSYSKIYWPSVLYNVTLKRAIVDWLLAEY